MIRELILVLSLISLLVVIVLYNNKKKRMIANINKRLESLEKERDRDLNRSKDLKSGFNLNEAHYKKYSEMDNILEDKLNIIIDKIAYNRITEERYRQEYEGTF